MQRTAIFILAVVFLLSVGATAQEVRSDISVQGTGFFTKDSTVKAYVNRVLSQAVYWELIGTTSIAGLAPR